MYNLLLEGETTNPMSIVLIVVMLVAIVALFIFSSVSNKKKQKQAQDMVSSLKIGDRVKTIGGICGFVAEINDAENTFVLETGTDDKKSYVKFDKGAIYQTAPAQGNCVAAPAEPKKEEVKEELPAKEQPVEAKEEQPATENVEASAEATTEDVAENKAEEKPAPKKTAAKKPAAKKTTAAKSATAKKTTAKKPATKKEE